MATMVENLKIELLTDALYATGNGDKVEEVNRKVLEYIAGGKIQMPAKRGEQLTSSDQHLNTKELNANHCLLGQ